METVTLAACQLVQFFCRVLPALLLDFRIYDDGDRAVIDHGALHVGAENTFLDRAAGDFCQSGAVFLV